MEKYKNMTGNATSNVSTFLWEVGGSNDWQIDVNMYDIYTFVLFIPGTLGNFLALAVILQKNLREMSSSVFIAVLAISDNLALLGFLLGLLSSKYSRHILSNGFCKLYLYILTTGSFISSWTVVAISIERVLVVSFPLKALAWSNRKKTGIVELCITILAALHNMHFFWTGISIPNCHYDTLKYPEFIRIYSVFDTCMSCYVPLALICLLNIIIMIQMNRAKVVHRRIVVSAAKDEDRKFFNSHKQITVMLVTVSVAFFLCMTPFYILQVLRVYIWDEQHFTKAMHDKVKLAYNVTQMLWMANHSINVVLYSLTGCKFRKEMLNMFTCGRRSSDSSRSPSTTHFRTSGGSIKKFINM